MFGTERTLLWIIRGGIFLLLFIPLIITTNLFFPFITGKNFFFRIIVEIIFGAWIILAVLYPDFRPRRSPLLFALLFFISVITLAAIFGVDFHHSFWSNFERMEGLITYFHLLAFFLVLAHSFKTTKEWFYFFHLSLGVSFILALHGFLQGVGAISMLSSARPYATFGVSIYLAVYLMFHLFIIIFFFNQIKIPWARILYGLLFLFELYVFFIAASRGVFIGLSAGIFAIALAAGFFSHKKIYRLSAFTLIFFFVLLAGVIFFFPSSPLVESNALFSRLSSILQGDLSQNPRIMLWGIVWDAFKEKPFLGWGLENFVIAYAKHYNPNLFASEPWFDRVHNMFLEWLVAAGIVGLFAYLSIFASAFFVLWKLFRKTTFDFFASIVIAGLLVAYLTQNFFIFDNILTHFMIISLLAFLHNFFTEVSLSPAQQKISRVPIGSLGNFAIVIGVLVGTIFSLYFLNVRQILAADQLIDALHSLRGERAAVERVIEEFDKAIAYGTFGDTEVRERIADIVVDIAVNIDQTNPAYALLLDYGIQEMEKEAILRPFAARYPLFLGKLYTIQMNINGEGFEKGELYYKKVIELAPNYIQAYLGLAELYLIAGKNENALVVAEQAFNLLDEGAVARSSLFYPVLSVYVLSGEFKEAIEFLKDFREKIGIGVGGPALGPVAEDIPLLIRRANRSTNLVSRAFFFREWNQIFIESYGFPQPEIVLALLQTYEALGENQKAREAALFYGNEEYREKAKNFASLNISRSSNPEAVRAAFDHFFTNFDAISQY